MENNVKIEELTQNVPFIVFEGVQARNERIIHRLITVIIVLIISLLVSNGAWLYYQLQYDYSDETETTTTTEYSQDGTGNNIIGNDNEVSVDEPKIDSNENNDTQENKNTE